MDPARDPIAKPTGPGGPEDADPVRERPDMSDWSEKAKLSGRECSEEDRKDDSSSLIIEIVFEREGLGLVFWIWDLTVV